MQTQPDKPLSLWAPILAADQERLARELGGVAGATRLVVLYRLTLDAFKRRGDTAEVSLNRLVYDTGLDRKTVSSSLASLAAYGMIEKLPQANPDGSSGTTRYRLTAAVPYGNSSPTVREKIPATGSPPFQESQEALNTKPQENTPQPPEGEVLPFGSEVFQTAWESWKRHRREKRQALTPTTTRRQLAMLGAMTEPEAIACVERSIANGWTGLFPEKTPRGGSSRLPVPPAAHYEISAEHM